MIQSAAADRKERLAQIGLKINKFVLSIPVIPSLFLSTSIVVPIRAAGLQRTLPATMLMVGLLSYPVVYVFSMVLSKKYSQKKEYNASIIASLAPIVCILLSVAGHLLMPK